MTYSQPARIPARRTRSTAVVVGFTCLALLLTAAALAPARHLLNDNDGTYSPSVTWPLRGQAALVVGHGRPSARRLQQPAPIASMAKVMTAYLTLKRYPLSAGQAGFAMTVTAAEAQDHAEGESVVAVQAGEQLTERQLLEALLVPSGNNIARILAAPLAGRRGPPSPPEEPPTP